MSWSPLDENDTSNDAVIGDEPFDVLAECFRKVTSLYLRDWRRKPSLRELVGTVQAVLEAQLQDHTSDGESAELASLTFKTRKIPRPLTAADAELPRGPVQIAGSNQQLEAANYYYGLGPKSFYNIEHCLFQKKGGG